MRATWAVLPAAALLVGVSGTVYDALMVTDVHMDLYYKYGSDIASRCHRGSGQAAKYGEHSDLCDTPTETFKTILSAAASAVVPPLVLYGGDSARHDKDDDFPRTEDEVRPRTAQAHPDMGYGRRLLTHGAAQLFNELQQVANGIRSAFPGAFVAPTIGNNDVYPHDVLQPGPNAVLSRIHDAWRTILPKNASASFLRGGYYASAVPGTRLVVLSLNTMYFAMLNGAVHSCNHDQSPGAVQMAWLAAVMDSVAAAGQRAIVLGHVPPLQHKWHKACLAAYGEIMGNHTHTAVAHLFGHSHGDAFAVLYSDGSVRVAGDTAQKEARPGQAPKLRGGQRRDAHAVPAAAIQSVPAVLPEYNPTYRVFHFNESSYALSDYEQHYFDLAHANEEGQATPALEYAATEAYSTLKARGFGANAFDALISQIDSDPAVADLYEQYASVMCRDCT